MSDPFDARRSRDSYPPTERGAYGVIATLVDPHDGSLYTVTYSGTTNEAVAKVCATCDRYGLKVQTLSHPLTILRDLDGAGIPAAVGQAHRGRYPESKLLAKNGRIDLCAYQPATRTGVSDRRSSVRGLRKRRV